MSTTFPPDLLAAQLELHQTRAEYDALCRTLPWSVEPMDGWEDTDRWQPRRRPASPGYTAEQLAEVQRLHERLRELSTVVSTHPFWASLEREKVVEARMQLKHAHERDADDVAA
ncbi:hypothetical protein [Streptomyces sp. NPDC018031]|uniref:hypothetical protein n=1 Tax=Streptomyces sp. NPDC018031 TaxID=3365033 RepID=UPI003797F5F7